MAYFSISTNRLCSTKSIKSQRYMWGRQTMLAAFYHFHSGWIGVIYYLLLLLLWQNTQQKELKKRRFYLDSQFQAIVHHGSRNMTWLVSLYPQSWSRENGIILLFLFSLWPKPIGWFWPLLECVFPFYWNPSGNSFIEMPRCVSSDLSDPFKLTITIQYHTHKSSTMKLLCSQDCWLYHP